VTLVVGPMSAIAISRQSSGLASLNRDKRQADYHGQCDREYRPQVVWGEAKHRYGRSNHDQ